ncbi:MAG: EVE domain-containing protein [Myxococcales bacterium]|nr:EVE domain-containing protein [Myxococcales bacterium]
MARGAAKLWLMKSEPDVYSIDDLERDRKGGWEGVRNYQARNFMREMAKGDLVIFYHSSTKPPGAAGVCRISREAYPDPTQFDPKSEYCDPKSRKDDPRWSMVDVEFVEKFAALVPLQTLKDDAALEGMRVTQKGSRLSVQPVSKPHFKRVLQLAHAKTHID